MTQQEFETTAKELRRLMYDVGLRYFHSQEDAEDVAQESLILLWRYCEKMDKSRNIRGLAVRVAKNCCISMKRKRGLRLTVDGNESGGDDCVSSADFDIIEAEECEAILEVTMQKMLTPRERELFEMRRLDGFSSEEIEARTGVKKATIQSMVSNARRKLLFELKKRMNR